ncbi:MAG: tetratricopeptide repeat protein [Candidatus Omnitrophica bacterium]|nr:tetratricopeptide repeat protein [Candidatus Omnitrophota bacterium]
MNTPTTHYRKIILGTAIFVLAVSSFVFAQSNSGNRGVISDTKAAKAKDGQSTIKENLDSMDNTLVSLTRKEEEIFTQMQKQARLYRAQGFEYQSLGDLQSATSLYQKAIQLDPGYAAAYNDLGVIYEAQGSIERAEQSYLRAVRIDPNFVSAYSNLALLYENKRDLNKAEMCWSKRAQLGDPNDLWTQKALQRLEDIRAVTSDRPLQVIRPVTCNRLLQDMRAQEREQEIVALATNMAVYKDILKKDNKALAASYMRKAKLMEQKGDQATAEKLAIDAQQLDPTNEKITEYIDKLQIRNLSK